MRNYVSIILYKPILLGKLKLYQIRRMYIRNLPTISLVHLREDHLYCSSGGFLVKRSFSVSQFLPLSCDLASQIIFHFIFMIYHSTFSKNALLARSNSWNFLIFLAKINSETFGALVWEGSPPPSQVSEQTAQDFPWKHLHHSNAFPAPLLFFWF